MKAKIVCGLCLFLCGFFLFAGGLIPGDNTVQRLSESELLGMAKSYAENFHAGETDELFNNLSDFGKNLISIETLEAMCSSAQNDLGGMTEIVNDEAFFLNGEFYYTQISHFRNIENVYLRFLLLPSGEIKTLGMGADVTMYVSEFYDYENQSNYSLPFDGEWYVMWGGRTRVQNYHVDYPDQRYANDLVMIKDGWSYEGDGKDNTDYYCFGVEVLSPADGTVLEIENGVMDNIPGKMNPKNPLGNYVIIDYGNDEYSFFAHFKEGSVRVKPGDTVKTGDVLALCGNSGNSSEAHIHCHLQNTPVFGNGQGLPLSFSNYFADSKFISSGELLQNTLVGNAD